VTRHDPLAVAARAVVAHPSLWPTALVQVKRLATPGWWRRWPPLPRPDPAWLAFRMETQYGSADAVPDAADVVAWLRWCRGVARARPPMHRGQEPLR
jgi:hypothetical protein